MYKNETIITIIAVLVAIREAFKIANKFEKQMKLLESIFDNAKVA